MSNKAKLLRVLLVIAVTFIVLTGLKSCKPKPEGKAVKYVNRIPVQVERVQKTDARIHLPSQGIVSPVTEASLAAEVSGTVMAKNPNFAAGGRFKKGDLLLRIDDRDYLSSVKLAESNYKQASVTLKEEQARGEQALRDWQRLGKTSTPSDLVARKPQLAATEAKLDAAEAQLNKARLDLSRTQIVAPYDGRVLANAIDEGNYVRPGTILGDIVQAELFKVDLPISASWRHLLMASNTHAPVELSMQLGLQSVTWQGKVARVSADVSATSRQFNLVVRIDPYSASNPDIALFIGDYVNASIVGRTLTDVILVPHKSVYEDKYVWVVNDDHIIRREVSVAWVDKNYVFVYAGLENGERYVTTALGNVISGTLISVIEPEPPLEQTSELNKPVELGETL